jgi:hypothetical protein
MFELTPTLISAANRRRSTAASFSLVLLSLAALGCNPFDEENSSPPDTYVPPVETSSDPGTSGDGDDSGNDYDYDEDYYYYYDDDYGDDYGDDYEDDDSRDLAGGTGGCSDTCYYPHDGECDDGGPGADYDGCAFGTDCGDCGTR